MSRLYNDENNKFQIDLSQANDDSTCSLHDIYKDIVSILNDVDWIAVTDNETLLIEFTHYEKRDDLPKGDRAEDKKLQIARKYYGSMFYVFARGMNKPVDFIWIAESIYLDNRIRNYYRESMTKWLPFKLQERREIKPTLIRQFRIFSVDDWNHEYPQFPLTKICNSAE